MRPTDPKLEGKYKSITWMGDNAYVEEEYPRFIMAADGARYHMSALERKFFHRELFVDMRSVVVAERDFLHHEKLIEMTLVVVVVQKFFHRDLFVDVGVLPFKKKYLGHHEVLIEDRDSSAIMT